MGLLPDRRSRCSTSRRADGGTGPHAPRRWRAGGKGQDPPTQVRRFAMAAITPTCLSSFVVFVRSSSTAPPIGWRELLNVVG